MIEEWIVKVKDSIFPIVRYVGLCLLLCKPFEKRPVSYCSDSDIPNSLAVGLTV